MENKPKKEKLISRRGLLPILGGSLLIPILGFGNTIEDETIDNDKESFQILLKPDGSTVKVKTSSIKRAKVIKKNITNKSFLNWLGKKF